MAEYVFVTIGKTKTRK